MPSCHTPPRFKQASLVSEYSASALTELDKTQKSAKNKKTREKSLKVFMFLLFY